MTSKLISLLGAGLLALIPVISNAQGNIFITGHDADDHNNSDYIRAGLDFLSFGATAAGPQIAARSTFTVGYVGNSDGGTPDIFSAGYTNVSFLNLNTAGALTTALNAHTFNILVIGTGVDFVNGDATGSGQLNANAAAFANYFNTGGSLFVNSEQGVGQSFYNFIPNFGLASANSINDQGAFSVTAAGLTIGLTETIVDSDITHTTFSGVSSAFTVFETYNPTSAAVAIGLRQGTIGDGGFQGGAVPEPSTYGLKGAAALVGVALYRRRKTA